MRRGNLMVIRLFTVLLLCVLTPSSFSQDKVIRDGKQSKPDNAKVQAPKKKGKAQSSEKASDGKIRLGVIDLRAVSVSEEVVLAFGDSARSMFNDIGLYRVVNRKEMRDDLKALKKKISKNCADPICLLNAGKILGLSKVVGGEISNDGVNYAVRLSIIDVFTGKTEGSAWLASVCTENEVNELIRAAVFRLHGQPIPKSGVSIRDYKGAEFSKKGMWAITTVFTMAAGVAYGMIDGGLTGRDANGVEVPDADQISGGGELSGLPGSFANLGYSARAHALGNAYVGVSNDAAGILWNPAGLARLEKSEVAASYLQTFIDIPYAHLGLVSRFSRTGAYGAALLSGGRCRLSRSRVYFFYCENV